jgi:hypothetical protein
MHHRKWEKHVMAGPNDKWTQPVEMSFSPEGKTTVSGPFEALAVLTGSWPGEQSLSFVKARSACRGALAGHKSLEDARREFETAADEARQKFERGRH